MRIAETNYIDESVDLPVWNMFYGATRDGFDLRKLERQGAETAELLFIAKVTRKEIDPDGKDCDMDLVCAYHKEELDLPEVH